MSNYKVLLTSSGTGSRLGRLVKNKNKALVKVAGKEIISHIIEAYNSSVEIVVTLGYKGKGVKDFLQKKYPERDFTFVDVKNFDRKGSSLGYSMLQARAKLQCPFIFHCNDTIVTGSIPPPDFNWNGGSLGNNPKIYNSEHLSSFCLSKGKMTQINGKGASKYDMFHIGLVGIYDYQSFWKNLENAYKSNPFDSSLNDVVSINLMIKEGKVFFAKEFKHWYDTGNLASLEYAKKMLSLYAK